MRAPAPTPTLTHAHTLTHTHTHASTHANTHMLLLLHSPQLKLVPAERQLTHNTHTHTYTHTNTHTRMQTHPHTAAAALTTAQTCSRRAAASTSACRNDTCLSYLRSVKGSYSRASEQRSGNSPPAYFWEMARRQTTAHDWNLKSNQGISFHGNHYMYTSIKGKRKITYR
jgi:hypothetical protein